jgi:hypothetical protein
MGNFVNPTNKVVVKGTADEEVLTVTGTVTECKPGRLVKRGADDTKIVIGDADTDMIGFLGFEQTFATYRPANISTAYALNDKATVVSGFGIHVMAYGSEAIVKGDLVGAAADGKVAKVEDGIDDAGLVVGRALETITGAGPIRIRSMI